MAFWHVGGCYGNDAAFLHFLDCVGVWFPLDSSRRTLGVARWPDETIDLTSKEYNLLVLLTSHPNWVFKREALLQQIWGDGYEGFDCTIGCHMMRLRKKLGVLGEKINEQQASADKRD
jgi:DNA-binding response OmpR family regulator